jgi:hypothetical protein
MKLITLSIASLLALTPFARAGVETGKAAPDFTLTDSQGKSHKLSDFKGKYVVLEWVNFGCPFVKKHYDSKNMQGLQKDYTGKDVVWLSICSSAPGKQGHMDAAKINDAVKEAGAAMTAYLIDEKGETGRLYGARTTPHMFIVNPEGNLIYAGGIDDIKSADPADTAKAKNFVKAALDEALAGKPVSTPTFKEYGCSVKYAD